MATLASKRQVLRVIGTAILKRNYVVYLAATLGGVPLAVSAFRAHLPAIDAMPARSVYCRLPVALIGGSPVPPAPWLALVARGVAGRRLALALRTAGAALPGRNDAAAVRAE